MYIATVVKEAKSYSLTDIIKENISLLLKSVNICWRWMGTALILLWFTFQLCLGQRQVNGKKKVVFFCVSWLLVIGIGLPYVTSTYHF